ncbi:CoA ester lyase [Intrasporangium sp.]|uniref:HpcH/HpaI aldolase/citrate lyase family protein n=1 Tax=Intrasporangium sp. TaxID=1925024 RepID=UPI003221A692
MTDYLGTAAGARALLFVPGNRPDRFDKAARAGADLVILDLEDAVAPADKDGARQEVASWLAAGSRACVRINAAGTRWHRADLAALRETEGVVAVVLPMADDAEVLTAVHRAAGVPVIALVETARGVVRAAQLAAAPGVVRLAFGALDLAVDLESEDPGTADLVRRQLVLASRAAGLRGPIDSVTPTVTDPGLAGREATDARSLGMRGKLCIHPGQVAPVLAAFRPAPSEIDWAQRVLTAGAVEGVTVLDGQMVDAPVLERARRILASVEGSVHE